MRPWRPLLVPVAAAAVLSAAVLSIAHNPRWTARTINAFCAVHLCRYHAVPFRREVLIPYTAQEVQDPNLPVGMHQVRTPGLTGAMLQTGVALYPLGLAGPRQSPLEIKVFSARQVSAPHGAVIAVGSSTDVVPANGHFYHFSRVLTMKATAYDSTWASNGPWTGQRSAIGLPLDQGIVAVDPSVIPLGSRLYVQNYGLAVAADTGSAIVGDRIDLFFWDTPAQTAAFGIQTLRVYVLDDPRLPPVPVPPTVKRALG